ncbi:MAG: oligosaccharide flippase family protein [Clostridia bacterium]|nr:oligosaccharide flippase family protein [Clostridia bacterium]
MELGNHAKSNVFWNMVGSIAESALNLVLLIVVNRLVGEAGGGIFTLAFSHAQMMYYLGTLEVRPIHSTDVKQKYRFADYFSLRTASCILMMLVCAVYAILLDGDPLKKRFMMYMCTYKMLDAFYDLFASMFQQHGRIAFSGQVSTVRVFLVLLGFTLTLLLTRSLDAAGIVMVLISLLVLCTYNMRKWKQFSDVPIAFQFSHAREILIACFPLFVSVFVMLYISNAPKYAIDRYCTDVIQNRYSILFMPAFVINLFSQFILRPMLTSMAEMWADARFAAFRKNVLTMLLGICLVTLLGIGGAWLLGIPFLRLLYGVDLTEEKSILLLVMVYGGLNAVSVFLYDMIAVTRQQKWLLYAYLLSALLIFFLAPMLVQRMQMTGAILSSIVAQVFLNILLLIIMGCVLHQALKKQSST